MAALMYECVKEYAEAGLESGIDVKDDCSEKELPTIGEEYANCRSLDAIMKGNREGFEEEVVSGQDKNGELVFFFSVVEVSAISLYIPEEMDVCETDILIAGKLSTNCSLHHMMYYYYRLTGKKVKKEDGYLVIPLFHFYCLPHHFCSVNRICIQNLNWSVEQRESVFIKYQWFDIRDLVFSEVMSFVDEIVSNHWRLNIVIGRAVVISNNVTFQHSFSGDISYPLEVVVWIADQNTELPQIVSARIEIFGYTMYESGEREYRSLDKFRKIQFQNRIGYSILLNNVSWKEIDDLSQKVKNEEVIKQDLLENRENVCCFSKPHGNYQAHFKITFDMEVTFAEYSVITFCKY